MSSGTGPERGTGAVAADAAVRLSRAHCGGERIARHRRGRAVLVEQVDVRLCQALSDRHGFDWIERARGAGIGADKGAIGIEEDEPLIEWLGQRAEERLGGRVRPLLRGAAGLEAGAHEVACRALEPLVGWQRGDLHDPPQSLESGKQRCDRLVGAVGERHRSEDVEAPLGSECNELVDQFSQHGERRSLVAKNPIDRCSDRLQPVLAECVFERGARREVSIERRAADAHARGHRLHVERGPGPN